MIKHHLSLIFLLSCASFFYAADTKKSETSHSVHYVFNINEYNILLKAVGACKDQAFNNRHSCESEASVRELARELDNQSGLVAKRRYNEGVAELDISINHKRIQGIRYGGVLAYVICTERGWQMES
jgi:hypothetical protein